MSLWGFVLPVYRKRQLRNWMFLEGYILLANMDWFWFSLDFESTSSLSGTLWASPVLILYKFHCYSWVDRKPSCALMEVRTKGWVLIKHEKIKSQGRNPERARLLVLLQVEQALSSSQSVILKPSQTATNLQVFLLGQKSEKYRSRPCFHAALWGEALMIALVLHVSDLLN